jgi:hypothetical protein
MERKEAITVIVNTLIKDMSNEKRYNILLDWWGICDEDEEFRTLPKSLQNEIINTEVPPENVMDKKYTPLLIEALRLRYIGVRNEYLSKKVSEILNSHIDVNGSQEELHPCPCCYHKTLCSVGEYEICPVCYWEDDGNIIATDYSSPNHMTLAQGQVNFTEFGVVEKSLLNYVDSDRFEKYSK